MSTTVTYKGSTIATVDNNTKTLTTQGKYLEGNIILTDVSGSGATDFVVTLSWDSTEQMWMPDKTLSEIYDAFSDGLNIVVVSGATSGTVRVYGEYEQYYNALSYFVDVLNGNEITEIEYAYDPNGVREVDRVVRILPNFESPSVTYTPTESQQTDTITPSQGYNGIDEVYITVGAISSTYIGSDVPNGNSLEYGLTDGTLPIVGVAKVGQAEL